MDQALRQDAERLRCFLPDLKDHAIVMLNPQGHVVTWNRSAEEIHGYQPDEILGEHFSRFFPAEANAQGLPAQQLEQAAQHGRYEAEEWRVRKCGTPFWANVTISALRDKTGTLQGFSSVTRDLTERKRHEEELRQSEERFRLLVESVQDYAIFLLDPQGRVASWNSGAEAIKGYKGDEIIGEHFSRFYPAEVVAQGWPEYELKTAHQAGRFEDEGWRVRKDGSKFWANVIITALRDSNGQLWGYSKVTRDLTERRQAEERLREVNVELEQRVKERTEELWQKNAALVAANRHKDEFLATLAHELRNPLAPIRTGLEVLKIAGDDQQVAEETRQMMQQQLEQMVRLIDDLLEVSRLTRGKLRLRKERMELGPVIRNALETTRPLVEESEHTLLVNLPSEPIHLDADPVRLAQIFSNLISNAAKYTDPGGHILVNVEANGTDVVVSVRDTGIGIPADHLPKVFEMFSQVESALDRSKGGLGIGLALVRGLVQMHKGTVIARSEGLGKGSEFIVRLPRLLPSKPVTSESASSDELAPPGSQCRILLVDDNYDAARIFATMLKIMGHDVRTAHDGVEAVQMASAFQPQLVLLDIGMPRMNGYEAARRIRSEVWGQDMRLVAVTGWGQEEDRRRALDAGFDHHLVKPIEVTAIQKIIAEVTA